MHCNIDANFKWLIFVVMEAMPYLFCRGEDFKEVALHSPANHYLVSVSNSSQAGGRHTEGCNDGQKEAKRLDGLKKNIHF